MDREGVFRILLRLSVVVFIVGVLFRISHWPFGRVIIITGLLSIIVFSILLYSSKIDRTLYDKLAIVLIPLWCLNVLTRQVDVPKTIQSKISIALVVLALLYCGFHAYTWYRSDKTDGVKKFNFGRFTYVLGFSLIGIGMVLKIQHIPYASECLLYGLVVSASSFMIVMFSKDSNR
ncbi:MAG: hypothetical protein HRT58_02390 [Crocinitomicaceae bacterium]|nr:hypothetical protein [Flavobacteriales bacterium]NQZ34477.1 hypothetical protein [Crocinitomicaceae bacterium]